LKITGFQGGAVLVWTLLLGAGTVQM